jgi:hypothetical protein
MRIRTLTTLALLALAGPAAAQTAAPSAERWQIQTDGGEYIWDIRLVKLDGEALLYRQADSLGRVPVQQIRELRRIQKTTVRLDATRSGGNGAMAALTGGDDEIYDFTPLDFAARLRALQQILLRYPPDGQ